MEKNYQPEAIEAYWRERWESAGYFAPSGSGTPYCIMIPPPNVTGRLHMGHGFQHTLMDALIRYRRMSGDRTLWQVGTDHAGIATQMLVERQCIAQGKNRHDLGREAFIQAIWDWKAQSGGHIAQQIRRIGASVDWSRESFTLDPSLSKTVQTVFIDLYREGLIYRGKRLVNWDPVLHTAISDLEVISETIQGKIWHIRFPLSDKSGHLVIATTRPETLLGDTAVAVHPEDTRYQRFIGKKIAHPLTGRTIPIIADSEVDRDFGTGCVKITPGHDFNDYAMGKRHDLPIINILTPDAHINDQAPSAYQGMERFAAREKILVDLEQQGLLEKIEPHTLTLPKGDRSGAIIEPYLTDQWFVRMQSLAKPAIEAVKSGELRFFPEHWANSYFHWLENIEDWCISRQLWWGHRIPAWYDEEGECYIGADEADVRAHYTLAPDKILSQDEDVLDTWFSSALWPFSTLGWPEDTEAMRQFYPTQVLVTGFDIIFFWVARMVMMGLKLTGRLPFHEIYITGLIRDAQGQKMSKSKGNVLDPIDLVDGITLQDLVEKRTTHLMQPEMSEKIAKATRQQFPQGIAAHGMDALRFTYCALASTGRDIRFDINRLGGYRNFCNKLWNAARFVIMQVKEHTLTPPKPQERHTIDRWMEAMLHHTIRASHEAFAQYRFDRLANNLYECIWNAYCDWYLEFTKPLLNDTTQPTSVHNSIRYTLVTTLETLLRLAHPCIPFITEAIWQSIHPLLDTSHSTSDTIMLQPYPIYASETQDDEAMESITWLQSLITSLRIVRTETYIPPGRTVPLLLQGGSSKDRLRLSEHHLLFTQIAKIRTIHWLAETETPPPSAATVLQTLKLYIPLQGLVDPATEHERLSKAIARLEKALIGPQQRLTNDGYLKKAPEHVVAKERANVERMQAELKKLKEEATLYGLGE